MVVCFCCQPAEPMELVAVLLPVAARAAEAEVVAVVDSVACFSRPTMFKLLLML